MPQETLDTLNTNPQAYLQEVTQLIADADSSDFTPNLDALVAMYRSIVIGDASPAVYFRNVPTGLKAAMPPGFVPY